MGPRPARSSVVRLGLRQEGTERRPPPHAQTTGSLRGRIQNHDARTRPDSGRRVAANSRLRARGAASSEKKIGDALASIDEQYDAVFIDCPPGITLANESAMRAAQVYLCPDRAVCAGDPGVRPTHGLRRRDTQGRRPTLRIPVDGRPPQTRAPRNRRAPAEPELERPPHNDPHVGRDRELAEES